MTAPLPPLVVHVIYALGTGGLENGLVNVVNRTPPERYRHAIVCLTESRAFAGRITSPGVEIVELHKQPGHDPAMYLRLWRALRRLSPDIVHTRNLAALETQSLGVLMPRTKRVHGEHGRDVEDIDGSNWKYRWLRRAMSLLVHQYIAVSRDLADWLGSAIGIRPDRIHQIYNGVDQQKFVPAATRAENILPPGFAPSEGVVLCTVGRLVEVKDQASLVEAFHLLLERHPRWRDSARLVLVGDGPLGPRLARQVADLGLEQQVWFAGEREDTHRLLQAADIFVLPSLGEGISNTLLEAMATGLPAVATDVGGNPELVEEGASGFLVPVSEPPALADALEKLVESASLRRRFGERALQTVRDRHNWDGTVEAYLGVYDALLGRSGRGAHSSGAVSVG